MTFKETLRYYKNEDTSTIAYKQFNQSPKDTYPTFSVCFTDDQAGYDYEGLIHTFYKDKIQDTLGISFNEYTQILKGEILSINKLDGSLKTVDIRNISVANHERFTIRLEDILNFYEFNTKNTDHALTWDGDVNGVTLPFYLSHQEPETICFTRRDEEKVGVIRTIDVISLTSLYNFHKKVSFKIYVHHPGQLVRNIDSPLFESTMDAFDWKKYFLTFKISQITILRKRQDANDKCNIDLHDDDQKRRLEVIKKVGCIPIYWTQMIAANFSFEECQSPQHLKDIYHQLEDLAALEKNYDPPCNEMELTVDIDKQEVGGFGFGNYALKTYFYYTNTRYQEIINVRDFGFESLWSGVGGFVGIFMGTSILQIPNLISEIWKWVRTQKRL